MNTRTQSKTVTLTINGREILAEAGRTLLEVARENDIHIPTLCFIAELSPQGACRLCLVEVEGVPRLLPACATTVSEGLKVDTESVRLRNHRKKVIELLLTERNHVCAVCVSNGNCELQALAQDLGVTHSRYKYRYQRYAVDASHPRFVHDPNRCVLCTRCVRICAEVEGARTWNIKQRGIHCELVTDLDTPWGESDSCTSCGKCVHICPTGALFERGRATGEMTKRRDILPCLAHRRSSFR